MLASVTNLHEAQIVLNAGVDIIDLKDPSQGSLGALDIGLIKNIVNSINHQRLVSATVGNIPFEPEIVINRLQKLTNIKLDYIKLGIFPGADISATLAEIERRDYNQQKLIAVFFADNTHAVDSIQQFAHFKFHGVMLDTADKEHGSLLEVMALPDIELFVEEAKRNHLLCGLAGSLMINHIPELFHLSPDYIGFRSALCDAQKRTNKINSEAVKEVLTALQN